MQKIIINADDFGLTNDVNTAIDYCIRNNLIQRTTFMSNMPYSPIAADLAKQGKYMEKVGLHINLIEGTPLSDEIRKTSLCNNGQFSGKYFKKIRNRFWIAKNERIAIECEIEAQIEAFKKYGFKCIHLDSHQHSHVNLSIVGIIIKLAKKHGFVSIRVSRNIPLTEINGLKRIYKRIVNRKIIKFNEKYYCTKKQYFGSKRDCETECLQKEAFSDAVIEEMIHPIYVNDKIIDNFSGEQLFVMKQAR